jgi:hypothetical protein
MQQILRIFIESILNFKFNKLFSKINIFNLFLVFVFFIKILFIYYVNSKIKKENFKANDS